MERRYLPQTALRTGQFLVRAYHDEAFTRLMDKIESGLTPPDLVQKMRDGLNALSRYYFLDYSNNQVGLTFEPPVTGEAARNRVKRGMAFLWKETSDKTKEDFPLDTIPLKKPNRKGLQASNVADLTVALAKAASEGRSYEEIRESGIGPEEISGKRWQLRKWGFEVGYKHLSPADYNSVIKGCSDPETDEKEYEEKILPKLTTQTALNIANTTDALHSLSDVTDYLGYHFGPSTMRPAKELLIDAGIAIHVQRTIQKGKSAGTVQNFYLIPLRKIGEAYTTLLEETSLDKYMQNPVNHFAGPEPELFPTTNDFQRGSEEFGFINDLLIPRGLANRTGKPKIPYEVFFAIPDCPGPVFRYNRGVVYDRKREAELIQFIEDRKRELVT